MDAAVKTSPSEQLLMLTQEMLVSAQAGDWDKLVELEKTRLPILDQTFSQGIGGNVELAKEVLSIDEKTKSLAIAEMPIIQDELQKVMNSGKANAAYQAVQGLSSTNK